ncbi:hypothetical protein Mgra_00002738 [Meloidogyne graminicola]|uniref:Uncharacterized protein n=1 Tax=Meloidogyne graminicola TaxID=189291 RepID=A0A8S9ZX84_9BILA|nr:hypothetical protein Mgra_00002738 [Meloidogyne graminicola]
MAPASSKRSKNSIKSKHNALSSASSKNFFKLEDELSKHLDVDKIGDDLRKIINEIRSLSASSTNNDKQAPHSKANLDRSSALILAVKLRNLNRLFSFRNRQENLKLGEVRQKVEEHYLSLQNVTNEITHMKKNIENCLEFRADVDDIELPEIGDVKMDMMNNHGEEKLDEHHLYLQRLNHELNERKRFLIKYVLTNVLFYFSSYVCYFKHYLHFNSLLSNLNELEGRKSALLSDIKGKEQRLSQIGPKIASIKKMTEPLLDLLGVSRGKKQPRKKAKPAN